MSWSDAQVVATVASGVDDGDSGDTARWSVVEFGDVCGKHANTGTGSPTITITLPPADDSLDLEFKGADPLVPLAPNIDDTLSITSDSTSGQVCYSGRLSGDAFPNTEVFVINSKGQATTLLNFATTYGRNGGPWTLLSPTVVPMGTFSKICVPK